MQISKGLRARTTLLAATDAPSSFRHTNDISTKRASRAAALPRRPSAPANTKGMPRARTGRPTLEHCRGGSCVEASRKPEVELGGHNWPRFTIGTHQSRSPAPLVRLVRRDGRRSTPIVMVMMLALHQQRRACATRCTTSGRVRSCMGQNGLSRALEQGFGAGARRGLPVRSDAPVVAERGAKALS